MSRNRSRNRSQNRSRSNSSRVESGIVAVGGTLILAFSAVCSAVGAAAIPIVKYGYNMAPVVGDVMGFGGALSGGTVAVVSFTAAAVGNYKVIKACKSKATGAVVGLACLSSIGGGAYFGFNKISQFIDNLDNVSASFYQEQRPTASSTASHDKSYITQHSQQLANL